MEQGSANTDNVRQVWWENQTGEENRRETTLRTQVSGK